MAAEWVEVTEVAAAGIQAIGEIGLDFACRSDRTLQTEVLRIQLRLAHRTGLPVVLHCVRAFEPLMRELAACQPREVIFHGFIGSPEQARTALSHGCYLSFGERTFASPKSLRALHEVPLDRLFLETDDAPVSIERIYDRAARELGLEVGVLRRATYENYKRIFEPKHENG
ncbi:TatD family hydrolase [uncultured Alistipes sp.]|uniref:TatD family hydrolase n=1 Tax=uncultured Alistipes sp. TaxID=538949 RepID=UPI002803FB53|nr:TatD family hydrolase [uncultured Alistipes sp.]